MICFERNCRIRQDQQDFAGFKANAFFDRINRINRIDRINFFWEAVVKKTC